MAVTLPSLPRARDGRLIVVSDDLAWYADADHIVPTMQALLDDWDRHAPLLELLSVELAHGAIPRKRFHEREAAAPLPRSYHRAGGSDLLRGARDAIVLGDEAWNAGFAPAVVVVTGDLPQGVNAEAASACIELVGLANEIVLRNHPAASGGAHIVAHCSPVFMTPEALGDSWRDGTLVPPVHVERSGMPAVAASGAGIDFGAVLAAMAATRPMCAGALVGVELPAAAGEDLRYGDCVRVDARDDHGHSLFGAIEQKVVRY